MARENLKALDKEMSVFKTIFADSITTEVLNATTMSTHRLDLDGISLSALMLRKLLADSQRIVSASNGDEIAALANLAAQMQTQLNTISNQLTSIDTNITNLGNIVNASNEFITILKKNALVFT